MKLLAGQRVRVVSQTGDETRTAWRSWPDSRLEPAPLNSIWVIYQLHPSNRKWVVARLENSGASDLPEMNLDTCDLELVSDVPVTLPWDGMPLVDRL